MRKLSGKLFVPRLAALLCLHLAAAGLSAQEAYKIDEAKDPRCDLSEVPPIDPPPYGKFASALSNNPELRGAIVVYGSLEGNARGYAERVRERLNNYGSVAAERLVTLYGGPAEETRLELWVIPKGVPPPKSDFIDDAKGAREFARYVYWNGEVCEPIRPRALAAFAEALKRRPEWRGHIVVRPHRNRRGAGPSDEGWDPDGYVSRRQALRRAVRDKRILLKEFGISPSRVRAVVGDNDTWTHSELWLVPPGAEPPAAILRK